MSGKLYIGTSGWYYDDWKPILFPDGRYRDPLRLLANFFNAAEVNSTYYRPIDASTSASWARRLRKVPDFLFTAKLWRRFTHEREEPPTVSEVEQFIDGLAPVADAGRLGALLAQFPWSFRYTPENAEWLANVVDYFRRLAPIVVEVRHDSWLKPEALQTLRDLQVGFCNIDQPRLGHCIPPTEIATSPVGYIRLHGRNAEKWFKHEEVHERYDYLYSRDELKEWVPRIESVREKTDKTFVFFNNHYRAKSMANALELKSLLSGEKQPVPDGLVREYPQLRDIVASPPSASETQQRLF